MMSYVLSVYKIILPTSNIVARELAGLINEMSGCEDRKMNIYDNKHLSNEETLRR